MRINLVHRWLGELDGGATRSIFSSSVKHNTGHHYEVISSKDPNYHQEAKPKAEGLGQGLRIWDNAGPNVGSFEINPFTVHQILGIPLGGRLVDKVVTDEARRVIAEDTGIRSTGPSISHLMTLLSDDLTDEKFLRIFMLILLSTFLCSTSHSCASPDYFNGIVDTNDIANYDWCSFVLDWLVEKIRQFQVSLSKPVVEGKEKSISLGGCLMIPLVMFFDYLDLKGTKIRNCIPRLPAWDDKAVGAFDNINFAQLKFKDISKTCFMQKSPCIPPSHGLPNEVAHFIDTLVPSDGDFSAKMKEMCTEFYKTSMEACFNALQPVLAKQMCTMVETIQNQVSGRASSSSTPAANEFTNQESNSQMGTPQDDVSAGPLLPVIDTPPVNESTNQVCNSQMGTPQDDVPARPLEPVMDTGFRSPSMGDSVLGTEDSGDGGDIYYYDLQDGDVVTGLRQLRRQGGFVMGGTGFVAEQDMSLDGDTFLKLAGFVQHDEENQLAADGEEVTDGQRCMSSPRGVDSTIQDFGMEDSSSAGTEAGRPKRNPNVEPVSIAGKSVLADRGIHVDLNVSVSNEHVIPISATERLRPRVSKRLIGLAVHADSESGPSRPLKVRKTRSSASGQK